PRWLAYTVESFDVRGNAVVSDESHIRLEQATGSGEEGLLPLFAQLRLPSIHHATGVLHPDAGVPGIAAGQCPGSGCVGLLLLLFHPHRCWAYLEIHNAGIQPPLLPE